ncbi:di-trans,poly-cis-decaprenylcistransferase [Treponema primitia ZAS-2]|uniref:Isoprenyl transferase n=1 Tax=Treponema primitia (strain ATCC BAA-887 / DSM 12427 / ZAS-2) TaxID=545694 RepID=F5YR62_TREPZ|nr:polyprenyl diphosphate synthase [Treponema primitia]AEF83550.1 di-trans,poly-cis-decaprenylcistransferase [Treponema primitia ZAS-2]
MSEKKIIPGASVPVHIGIIMDGNGRWAQKRNQNRTQGHLEGLKTAKRIVKAAGDMGIRYLTLYVFSTENWKRTAEEVGFIMGLVKRYLIEEMDFYRQNRIRIRHTGDPGGLPPDIVRELRQACDDTRDFQGLQVILALNYGGRDEIRRAVQRIVREGPGEITVTEDLIRSCLDNPDIPDPDLIIRTAGELRTSNFLLWEAAYSEYYISDILWPDWTEAELQAAVLDFQSRERRFGAVPGIQGRINHE